MRVTSREYKVIVDSSLFADLDAALSDVVDDIGDLARSLDLECAGNFDATDPKERTILFLDTPDFTLRQNGLLLRQRVKRNSGATEYTLKCRTEDRYVAAGRDLRPGPQLEHDSKFEEDIGVPFISRFSHSMTVSLDEHEKLAGKKYPDTLAAAAKLFPGLLTIRRDRLPCPPETALAPVHDLKVLERVFTGPTVHFPGGRDRSVFHARIHGVDPLVERQERPHPHRGILFSIHRREGSFFFGSGVCRQTILRGIAISGLDETRGNHQNPVHVWGKVTQGFHPLVCRPGYASIALSDSGRQRLRREAGDDACVCW